MDALTKIAELNDYCNSVNTAQELGLSYIPFEVRDLLEDNFSLDKGDWEDPDESRSNEEIVAEMLAVCRCKMKHLLKICRVLTA